MIMKKTRLILSAAIALLSIGCIAVLLYFVIAERRSAAKLNEATELFRKGSYEKAVPLLAEIIRKDPSNESACRMMAEIAESEYNFAAALQYYRMARNLNPLDPAMRVKYIETLSAAGEFRTLLNEFKSGFERNELSGPELFCYLEALIATGKTEEAKLRLAKPEGIDPVRVQYLTGMAALRENRSREALELLSKADSEKLPFSLRARLLSATGNAAAAVGDKVAAEAAYTELAKLAPMSGPYLLAEFYRQQGDGNRRLEWLKKAVAQNPRHLAARIDLAEYYTAEKDSGELKKLVRNPSSRTEAEAFSYIGAMTAFLEKRYADTAKLLAVASPYSERPLYQAMKLQCLIDAEEIDKLPACTNALLAAKPTPEARALLVSELYPLLTRLYRDGSFEKANEAAKLVLTLSNGHSSPARTLALEIDLQNTLRGGDPAQAGIRLNALLAEAPDNPFANLTAGNLLLGSNQPERALVHFKRLPESNAAAQFGIARAEMALGETVKAGKAFAKAWSLAPGALAIFESYAEFLNSLKRGDEIEKLAAALPATPEARFLIATARANRAIAANRQGEARDLRLAALKELDDLPATPMNDYRRANLYALTDQDIKAEPVYDKLLESFPRWLPVLVNQSEVKAALGHQKEALELAQRAIRVAPDSEAAKLCLKRRIAETGK